MTKFAIQIENQFGYSWEDIEQIVNKTEEHGFHSFYICDHFFLREDSVDKPTLEAWTVLTAASMISENINLGTLVTGNNYRNPALLAKIAASLDMISDGRMEFGIGAGWKEIEYKAYGYDFPPVGERMDRLEESIQIIQKLFDRSEEKPSFEGEYHQIKDAVFSPKPNDPLFMIGGGGEKRTLRMVAKYADYCNLPFTPVDQLEQKLDALKGHCEDLGRDYEEIGKSYFSPMRVFEDEEAVDNYIKQRAEVSSMSEEELRKRYDTPNYPGSSVGTPEQVRDRIEYMNGLGFDYYFIQQPIDLGSQEIGKFAELVMNKYFK